MEILEEQSANNIEKTFRFFLVIATYLGVATLIIIGLLFILGVLSGVAVRL